MKIIDANSSPPVSSLLRMRFYAEGMALTSRSRRGLPSDPALTEQSIDLFLQQQSDIGVVHTLVHGHAKGPGGNPLNKHNEVTNEEVAHLCAKYSEFSGVACFDPVADPAAADKVSQVLQRGFIAAEVMPGWMPEPTTVDDRRLFPFYEACMAQDRPVFILSGGNAGPDRGFSDPLFIDRVAASFPRLKIIVRYAGWPYVQQVLGVVFRRPNVWLIPDTYFPAMPGEQDYLTALKTYAKERFLFSVYYPMNPQHERLQQVHALGLPASVLDRYLFGNAAELFDLTI